MELTPNGKRDAEKYIEAGKPLPDKYHFLLFKEKWIGDYIFENDTMKVIEVNI